MIDTVVVGHGLAGRSFHCPLIRRQPGLRLHGVVARDPQVRAEADAHLGRAGASPASTRRWPIPAVRLVVIATPHDTHAELAVRALEAGKDCVVDKVMALSTGRGRPDDRRPRRLGPDALGLPQPALGLGLPDPQGRPGAGLIGRPLLFESAVCRYAAPRAWRGQAATAGTILHDWGAHLVDQALQLGLGPCRRLSAWLTPAPWPGVDSGGHGRIVMEFDDVAVPGRDQPRLPARPARAGGSSGTDGRVRQVRRRPPGRRPPRRRPRRAPRARRTPRPAPHARPMARSSRRTSRPSAGSWDAYYANIADHLKAGAPLAVTAEQAARSSACSTRPMPFVARSYDRRRAVGLTEGCGSTHLG